MCVFVYVFEGGVFICVCMFVWGHSFLCLCLYVCVFIRGVYVYVLEGGRVSMCMSLYLCRGREGVCCVDMCLCVRGM